MRHPCPENPGVIGSKLSWLPIPPILAIKRTPGRRAQGEVSQFMDFEEEKDKLIFGKIIDNLVEAAYNRSMIQTSPRLSMMRTMAGSFF